MKALYPFIIVIFFSAAAFAQAGELDSTFGGDGVVVTAIGGSEDAAQSIAIQSDGKIVAAGYSWNGPGFDFALVRYNTDGSLDNSFGNSGKVTTDLGTIYDYAHSVAIQPDGKIVAAGSSRIGTYDDFALVRYKTDGTVDSSFSADGIVTTSIGPYFDVAWSVAIQSDGEIIAAGYSNNEFALVRYDADGTLDSSFSMDGIVTTDIGPLLDLAYSVAIQPDGKIIAAGCSAYSIYSTAFALIRYNTDGNLDNSFGTNGRVITSILSMDDEARSIAIQSDGKIVAAGFSFNEDLNKDFSLARYNADGTLDSSFSTDGKVTAAVGGSDDWAHSVAIQPDGKIVVAGFSTGNPGYDFALIRCNSDGMLDTTFGTDGKVITAIGLGTEEAYSVAIQPDGKIVAAGYSFNGMANDFAVARYISGLNVGIVDFSSQQSSPLIYPNPIQQTGQLDYTLTNDEALTLNLNDVNGREVKNFFTQQKRTAGPHKEQLNIGALAAGNYFLTLSNGSQKITVKMVKQ